MTRLSRILRGSRGGEEFRLRGRAVLGRRTKEIVPRLDASTIPCIDHENLDRVTAETLVESGVGAVVNAGRSATGSYPNLGPVILARAGVHIVDGVGVGKGVFYWYFPSKDELLLEILREAHYDLRRAQIDAIGPEQDPVRRIERGIEASLSWAAENPEILRLVMFGWTEETFAKALRKGRRIAIADTARHVGDAIEQGRMAPGDPAVLATAIRGVTDELSRQYALGGRQLDDEVVRSAVRVCLYGLVGPRG